MLACLGDFPVGTTVPFPFPAYDSNGASVTITGLATTDIEIYKGTSMTQRASDNGYALLDTDGIDIDSRTGIHGFSVDLADNSDAGFYAAGSIYWIVVDAITVDSQTVRFIFYFTIGLRLYPTTIGRTLDVSSGGEAGIDWANIGSPTTVVNLSGTTVKTATDVETDTADIQSRLPAALTGDGNIKADTLRVGGTLQTAGDIIGDTNDIQTRLPAALVGGRIDANVGAISSDATAADNAEAFFDGTGYAGTNNVIPTVTTLTGHTPQTGDNFARLGAPAGASISADIADVEGKVDDLESRLGTPSNLGSGATVAANLVDIEAQTDDIGSAGAGLTGVPWNAAWDAEVQSEVQDAVEVNHLDHLLAVDYDPTNKPGVATALLNELIENDGGVSQFTANALEEAPAGGGGGGGETTGFTAAALLQLAGLQIRVSSPANGPNNPLIIVRGDDYLDADGRAQTFTLTGDVPDLDGATGTLTIKLADTEVAFDIETPTEVGDDWEIKVEMTTIETAALTVSTHWKYDLQLTLATGAKYTPLYKRAAHVVEDFTS